MEDVKSSRKAGRPREFCTVQALDAALRLFQRKGYEGTSLTDLTEAIGVNRPSLYAAFGSKEELFRKVLARYAEIRHSGISDALALPTVRGVAEALLFNAARELGQPDCPGCLLVQGALACSDESEAVRRELGVQREALVEALHLRFQQAQAAGDLPPDAEPSDLARYVMAVINGMSVQAAGGSGAEELRRVAEIALLAWPESELPSH